MTSINGVNNAQAEARHRRARKDLAAFQESERERLLACAERCNKMIEELVKANGESYRPRAEQAGLL